MKKSDRDKAEEHESLAFHVADQRPCPVFDPEREFLPNIAKCVVAVPPRAHVEERIYEEMNAVRIENFHPKAILLGLRWHLVLAANSFMGLPVLLDGRRDRGAYILCTAEHELVRWSRRHCPNGDPHQVDQDLDTGKARCHHCGKELGQGWT